LRRHLGKSHEQGKNYSPLNFKPIELTELKISEHRESSERFSNITRPLHPVLITWFEAFRHWVQTNGPANQPHQDAMELEWNQKSWEEMQQEAEEEEQQHPPSEDTEDIEPTEEPMELV
jgi:hypothetical protein